MAPHSHPRGLFSGRPAKGLPPSLCRILLGAALLIAIANEVFYAVRSHQLEMPEVASVNPANFDSSREGHDLHLAGTLSASSPAADPVFGPIPASAVLRRTEETRTGMRYARGSSGGRKTPTWGRSENGGITVSHAAGLALGTYPVDGAALATHGRFLAVVPTRQIADQLALAAPNHRVGIEGDWYVLESTLPPREGAEFLPAFRIRFEQIPFAPVTIAGRLDAGILRPVAVSAGIHSAQSVVEKSRAQSLFQLWAVRLLAAAGILAGIHLLRQANDLIRLYGPGYFPKP